MPSPEICTQLQEKLASLRTVEKEIQDLQKRLLTEGSSSVNEVKKAFLAKSMEVKSLKSELEKLLKEASPDAHKDTPESIKKLLKEIGTPATLDESFEGGIIALEIDKKTLEQLKTWGTAKKAYEAADNASPSWVWDQLDNIPYTLPTSSSLGVLVLNHGETTPQERDKLVADLDKKGFRPLEFSELVALGIMKPEYNKRNEILNTYKKYTLGGGSQSPYLDWSGGKRVLDADGVSNDWNGHNRFVFVRK
ncbi:MAG: hypothetical protein E6Q68_08535 [Polynucleobacter sp.]|nr:MAG: hypothetical protein E6Q68_08535 [Polynucleobacter sp.]